MAAKKTTGDRSYSKLAQRLGITRQALNQYLNETKTPGDRPVLKILAILGNENAVEVLKILEPTWHILSSD
jgi:hypothetical protein